MMPIYQVMCSLRSSSTFSRHEKSDFSQNLLYAIIIAPAALTGYRRSVREGHDGTSEHQRQGTDRYKQAQKKALITKRYLDNQCLK